MTVKQHIKNYISNNSDGYFYTSDIQELAADGVREFGIWLGSPSSYERVFRTLKTSGEINVLKTKRPGMRQVAWRIER